MTKFNAYAEVTATILEAMKSGTAPWVKPWRDVPNLGIPHNVFSGKHYRGINSILGWIAAEKYGFASQGWLTYKQATELGGNVKKGEKCRLQVVFFKQLDVKDKNAKGEDVVKKIPLIRLASVFNVEQCEGLKLPKRTMPELRQTAADQLVKTIADKLKMVLKIGGNRACYIPALDIVQMPPAGAFNADEAALATYFHEAGHWTGHKTRLDRDLSGRFGNASYAFEELVAELTSAFLCAANRVNGRLQHPEYLRNWISVLENDDKAFMKAASLAQAAADYIGERAE
jgi:antirestriction protein ArdC